MTWHTIRNKNKGDENSAWYINVNSYGGLNITGKHIFLKRVPGAKILFGNLPFCVSLNFFFFFI